MKIYTKNGYITKLRYELNECLDGAYYDTEKAYLDGYYNKKIEEVEKKLIPIVIDWSSFFKIVGVTFGTIAFLAFIFAIIIIIASGFNLNKLLIPIVVFLLSCIITGICLDKYTLKR